MKVRKRWKPVGRGWNWRFSPIPQRQPANASVGIATGSNSKLVTPCHWMPVPAWLTRIVCTFREELLQLLSIFLCASMAWGNITYWLLKKYIFLISPKPERKAEQHLHSLRCFHLRDIAMTYLFSAQEDGWIAPPWPACEMISQTSAAKLQRPLRILGAASCVDPK